MKSLVDQWKERCKQIREEEEKGNVVVIGKESMPSVKLYNIVKRSVNGKYNRVVGIGFTKSEAERWIERKTNKAVEKDNTVIYFDIVDQDEKEQMNPFWNPRPFYYGEVA